jgi:hypothetical protein
MWKVRFLGMHCRALLIHTVVSYTKLYKFTTEKHWAITVRKHHDKARNMLLNMDGQMGRLQREVREVGQAGVGGYKEGEGRERGKINAFVGYILKQAQRLTINMYFGSML